MKAKNLKSITMLVLLFTLILLSRVHDSLGLMTQTALISTQGTINYEPARLHVEGKQIMLANGQPIRLEGVNMGGPDIDYNTPPTGGEWIRVKESYFDYCKSWSLNVVRLCISWDLLQPGFAGPLDTIYLSKIDQTIEWARARNIYIIIDLHYQNHYPSDFNPYPFSWSNDFWYPYSSNTPTLRDAWIEMWKLLANYYQGAATIAFFNLCNEPHVPSEVGNSELPEFTQAWMSMANEASKAIHSIDPNRIVGIDPPSWSHPENMDLVTPIDDPNPNIVYTPHYYWKNSVIYTNNPLDILDGSAVDYYVYIRPAITWMTKYNKPVLFTEFGNIDPNRPDLEQMLRDFLNICEQSNIGWVYWQFVRSDNYGLLRDPGFSGSGVENPTVSILREYTQGI